MLSTSQTTKSVPQILNVIQYTHFCFRTSRMFNNVFWLMMLKVLSSYISSDIALQAIVIMLSCMVRAWNLEHLIEQRQIAAFREVQLSFIPRCIKRITIFIGQRLAKWRGLLLSASRMYTWLIVWSVISNLPKQEFLAM